MSDEGGQAHLKWAAIYEAEDRQVALTQEGDFCVSTIWLGLDHNFTSEGPPLIFESLVRDNDGKELHCERYATEEEAKAGHRQLVERYTLYELHAEAHNASPHVWPLLNWASLMPYEQAAQALTKDAIKHRKPLRVEVINGRIWVSPNDGE